MFTFNQKYRSTKIAWAKRNPEKIQKAARKHRELYKEKYLEYQKQYRERKKLKT